MYTPAQPKRNPNILKIHVDPLKVKRGHQAHLCGAGTHQDKRLRRKRTRAAQQAAALCD